LFDEKKCKYLLIASSIGINLLLMLNRLETYRGLRDVKYIVYKLIHRYYYTKCLISMNQMLRWNERGFLMHITGYAIFNRRHPVSLEYLGPICHWDIHNCDCRKIFVEPVNKNGTHRLPKRYWYSSPEIKAKIY